MQITFLGATGTVTGSKYLLKIANQNILIDCGLFQGYKELRLRNWAKLPIEPSAISAVILTHAHIDHSGYLPLLIKNGFKGPIFSTEATKDLCAILLSDSGHLQEEAFFANKHGYSKHHPALPLYTRAEAEYSLKQFKTLPYGKPYHLLEECTITLAHSGHILGSALAQITYQGKKVLFTGDLGRPHDPLMRDPANIECTDYLIIESTYGDRLHDTASPIKQLGEIINQTAKRGGTIVIPAFAVDRSQDLIYYIYQLKKAKLIHGIPVYLDSPMAINVSHIYIKHREEHRLSTRDCEEIFGGVHYINTPEESKELDNQNTPAIIISASGMATGGRVLHHLKTFAPNAKNTLLFTGFQASGTRGDRIVSGEHEIKMLGQMVPIKASVKQLNNMSAHADATEILNWLGNFKQAPKTTFITHGELAAANSLKAKIVERYGWQCIVPHYLETVTL